MEVNHNLSDVKMRSIKLSLNYGEQKILEDINLDIKKNNITALIGPSGSGKTSFLRCLNRMNDLVDDSKIEGKVILDDRDIYGNGYDVVSLRKRVGMVFQKPNPFPKSIYENVAYGPRIFGVNDKATLDGIVEESLKRAALWGEVKNKLKKSAFHLSGGQQQRLCIGRVLAVQPEVILLDEPCSSLDPIATQNIEDLMAELKSGYTLIIVTHNMQQAARTSDYTAFFMLEKQGKPAHLIECNETSTIFTRPSDKRTERYITGRFG